MRALAQPPENWVVAEPTADKLTFGVFRSGRAAGKLIATILLWRRGVNDVAADVSLEPFNITKPSLARVLSVDDKIQLEVEFKCKRSLM